MQNGIVFLIGFMGVGKTTLGKKLANRLNVPFIDIDTEIEKKNELSISYYFERFGESSFREEETKILEEVIRANNKAIVSVGGGLPCFNRNMERMNSAGITCYLRRPAKELFQRLKNAKTKRPLIANLNEVELLSFIEEKLTEREEFYLQSKIIIGRDQQNVGSMVEVLEGKS